MRGRVRHSLNYSRFQGGWRREGLVGDGGGGRGWTCRETTDSHECATGHTVVSVNTDIRCTAVRWITLLDVAANHRYMLKEALAKASSENFQHK